MTAVRWGILSTGRINQLALLEPARQTDRAEVIAVASREQERAEAYARKHGIERAYGSYDAQFDNPDVEAIYISLPNSLHADWSIRALEAGKHVLAEKPFSRHPDEVERAFDTADRAGRLLMEAFMYRHHDQTRRLEEMVASGAIGELRQLRSSFSFTLGNLEDVRMLSELDGGALMDLGCYCLSGCRLLGGEPELVVGRQFLGRTGVDIRFVALLQFPGDVFAQFHCAFDLPEGAGLEAFGSEATALVREPFRCIDPHIELNGDRIEVDHTDRYLLQLENFSAAIRDETEPLLGREDALGQARTIDALYRSAASGTAVSL